MLVLLIGDDVMNLCGSDEMQSLTLAYKCIKFNGHFEFS
jgi:hypothetical protein